MLKVKLEQLLVIYFISITLAIYNIPVGTFNLSVDRIMVLPVFVIILLYYNKKIPGITEAITLLAISSTLSVILPAGIEMKNIIKLLPSYILCLFILFNATKASNYFDISFTTKILRIHWLIILSFTLYGFYHRYILNEINFVYPFNSLLGDLSTDEHKVNMIRYFRLFFPLSSAPRLGFVSITLLLYHIYIQNLIKRYSWLVTASLIFVTVTTISRGPIAAIFVTLWISMLLRAYRENKLKSFFGYHLVLVITLFFSYLVIEAIAKDFKSFTRLLIFASDDDSSFEGHLGVRLRVINSLLNSDFISLFFGNGLGHFQAKMGTSSAHSSIFTQVFEQGIFGLLTYIIIYCLPIFSALRLYLKYPNKLTNGLFVISLFLFMVHFTYDAITTVNLWMYQGCIWGIIIKTRKNYGQNLNNYSNT